MTNCLELKVPLRYLIFTLSEKQRITLLKSIFVAIFADKEHPNPQEAFALFKIYFSYFSGLPSTAPDDPELGDGEEREPSTELLKFSYMQFLKSKESIVETI